MKKIGTTSSGSVIVEMTEAQFEAFVQSKPSQPTAAAATQPDATKMSLPEKVAYVRERVAKLKPKKKDGLAHSISAMFQFTGGIAVSEIAEITARLQKEKFLIIDDTGRVAYKTP